MKSLLGNCKQDQKRKIVEEEEEEEEMMRQAGAALDGSSASFSEQRAVNQPSAAASPVA